MIERIIRSLFSSTLMSSELHRPLSRHRGLTQLSKTTCRERDTIWKWKLKSKCDSQTKRRVTTQSFHLFDSLLMNQLEQIKVRANGKFLIIGQRELVWFHLVWLTGLQLSWLRGCESVKGHTFGSKWLLFILLLHKQALYLYKIVHSHHVHRGAS